MRSAPSGKVLDAVIAVIALAMVLYHLISAQYILEESSRILNTHLAFALVVTFLTTLRKNRKGRPFILILALLSLASTGYVGIFFTDLLMRTGANTYLDLTIGVILIVLCIEATRQAFGLVLPILASVFILYCFFGYILPAPLSAMGLSWELVVGRLSLSVGLMGLYSNILMISANYIFLFMVFAAMISATGSVGFFSELGKLIGRKVRAGPALAAVITSGMVGSLSGSAGANVMITGSFTIPAMKKVGYTPEQAGAIEAASSAGGPIFPPVMGATAFIMVAFTGFPYTKIIAAAVIPALLYIFSAASYTYFQGEKMRVSSPEEKVDVRTLLIWAPMFIIPLLVVVILFFVQFTPMVVSFWACITIFFLVFMRKSTRPSVKEFLDGLIAGAELGSKVAVTCALLGIVVSAMTMTGLAIKLPHAVASLCGENLILLLLFTGVISIVLGMGLPSSAAYVMVAIAVVPILVRLGVAVLPAHFFAFFMANFSFITPPVAISALFASQLAHSNYIKTAIQASIVGMAGFVIPFMIIFCPAFIYDFSQPIVAATTLIACPAVFLGLQAAVIGYFAMDLALWERMVLMASSLLLIFHIYTHNFICFVTGMSILVIFSVRQIGIRRQKKKAQGW